MSSRSSRFGSQIHRIEDRELISGEGRFTDDIVIDGMLHAAFARSPFAHALIRSIDRGKALELEGVVAVLALEDYTADGCQPLRHLLPDPTNSRNLRPYFPERWPLAKDRLRFVGDPYALVIAETRQAALDAAELLDLDARPLPVTVGMSCGAARKGEPIWPRRPDNVCFVHESGDRRAVDAAFAGAAHVVSQTLVIPRVAVSPLEPRGCVAEYLADTAGLLIHVGVQDAFGCRRGLADALGRPAGDIHVATPHVGGSFGLKYLDPETVLVSWAADRLKRTVKWVSSRSEAFISDNHARDNVSHGQLALDENGTFLALRVRTFANVGAYPSPFAAASPTNNLGSLAGVYRTPAIHVEVIGEFTNTNPTGPYRGAGRPEASYAIERLVDLAALRVGVDRVTIRRRNMIRPDQMPFRTGLTHKYDCGEFEAVMDRALAASDWEGFAARRSTSAADGRLRGIGISTVIERATLANTYENVVAHARPDGTVKIAAGSSDQGQGHATMYAQLASEWLATPVDNIEVVEADTRELPAGGMTGSSRVSAMGSAALQKAIDALVLKGRRVVGLALETDVADVEFVGGRFRVVGTDRALGLQEVARLAMDPAFQFGDGEAGLAGAGRHDAVSENFPNGCHVCEVEIDPETGLPRLCSYVVVDDVGEVINERLVEGQLHGGLAQGIGEALIEAMRYDDGGQPVSGSFMDYAMPRAGDVCNFTTFSHPVPTKSNPLGVKGAGEAGTVGSLPAVVGAIMDALSACGIQHLDMPLTSLRILGSDPQAAPLVDKT